MTQAQSQPGVITHSPVRRSYSRSCGAGNGGIMRPVRQTVNPAARVLGGGLRFDPIQAIENIRPVLGHEQKVGRMTTIQPCSVFPLFCVRQFAACEDLTAHA